MKMATIARSIRFLRLLSVNRYLRERGVIDRQRVTVFVYTSALLVIGVILNLCGVAGPSTPFFQVANITQGISAVLGFYLYYNRRISLTTAMSLLCIVMQVEISAETIYCAINKSSYDVALIIANMALSAVVLLLGIIAYLRAVPYIVALLSLSTFVLSIYTTGSEVLANFFLVFLVVFLAFSLLGGVMIRSISRLNEENSQLKNERQEILDVFHLTKEELRSYMTLAQEKNLEPDKTAEILALVGSAAEKHILDNVAFYIRQTTIEFDKLRERFPELTPSELEICALILKEKKQKEVIDILGKSRSNITCQRTNIRAKLNMQPDEKLYDVLKKRMGCR